MNTPRDDLPDSEKPSRRLGYLPPMSQDFIITHHGKRVLWAERVFGILVVPLLRWYVRLSYRLRQ